MEILSGGPTPYPSTHIHSVLWTDKGMVIVFHDNRSTYLYPDVNRETFEKLYGARSPGGFFRDNIKGLFEYKRLD